MIPLNWCTDIRKIIRDRERMTDSEIIYAIQLYCDMKEEVFNKAIGAELDDMEKEHRKKN